MPIEKISLDELDNLDKDSFIILWFHADWAITSKTLSYKLQKIKEENNSLNILKVDIDDPDFKNIFNIRFAPTLIILKNNNVIAKKSGLTVNKNMTITKEEIQEWINSFIETEE